MSLCASDCLTDCRRAGGWAIVGDFRYAWSRIFAVLEDLSVPGRRLTAVQSILCAIGVVQMATVTVACAQGEDPRFLRLQSLPASMRTITTTGSADLEVVPDKVKVTFAVKTFDKSLQVARSINDTAAKDILQLAAKYKIEPGDVQTTDVSIDPVYSDDRSSSYRSVTTSPVSKPLGYSMKQAIGFVLRNPKNASLLISDALEAGANSIESLTYESSQMRQHKDKARQEAFQAAILKAAAIATLADMSLGKALHVEEESVNASPYAARAMYSNTMVERPSEGAADSPGLALGRIPVRASYRVTFEMN